MDRLGPMNESGLTTPHYIEYHALVNPTRVAMVWPHASITYRQLYADMLGMLRYVRERGVAAGHIIGVCHDDIYVHWLLLLACECAGAATMSFQRTEPLTDPSMFMAFDAVIADIADLALPAGVRHDFLGAEARAYLRGIQPASLPWLDTATSHADDIVRVGRTSGSTGTPKRLQLRRSLVEDWIAGGTARNNYAEGSVELVTAPPAVHTAFCRVHGCLRSGVTTAFGSVVDIARRYRITHAFYLPIALMDVLAKLAANTPFPLIQRIQTGGGPMSQAKREEAMRKLCADLHNVYGSNEAAMICAEMTPQGQGVLGPGMQAWVTDEQGQPLPHGQDGELWIRTHTLIPGYWEDVSVASDRFVDGAFRTGDRARMVGPRRLQLLGRMDDVVNLGGIKTLPQPIEDGFLSHPSVREAAIVMRAAADGGQMVAVLSLRDGADLREVLRTVLRQLPVRAQDVAALQVSQLPRSPGGKVDRAALRAAVDRMVKKSGQPPVSR